MLIKLGDLLVSHEKSYMDTNAGERFPVKISFTRKLTDDELTQLAIQAALIEKGFSTESRRG